MSSALTSIGRFFSPWRHPIRTLLIVIVLITIFVWVLFFKTNKDADNYLTATVERSNIQNLVTATGILQPRQYVDVGAQVSGQLKKLYVSVGSEVTAGDLLAEIDATVYAAKVDGIRAQLRNQQAQLGDREAQLKLSKIQFERQQNLFKDDATTQDSVQIAEAEMQSAQSQLKSLQAQIQQTEFSLRVEEANLTYARIYAPMTGTVVTLTSRQGQTLNANQQAPTIMRIADLSTMTVQTQVSEADIGKLTVGMPVYFTTLGGRDYRWYSKLNRVEPTPTVTNSVVLYNALFDVPNDLKKLMTQMSAQVFFVASSAEDTLLIPASAVNFKIVKPGEEVEKKSGWGDRSVGVENRSVKESGLKEKSQPKDVNNSVSPLEKSQSSSSQVAVNDQKSSVENKSTEIETKNNNELNKNEDENKKPAGFRDRQNANGNGQRRHRERTGQSSQHDAKPQTAIVHVMDKKGNLTERNIVVGISNRVQVQVLEGLREGETVVIGKRQEEKSANASPTMGPSASGSARMMR